MKPRKNNSYDRRVGGHALVVVLVGVAFLAALAGAGLTFNQAVKRQVGASVNRTRALYMAEAGVADAVHELALADELGVDPPANLGTADAPWARRGGEFWVTLTDNGDDTVTLSSSGRANRATRTIEVVLERATQGLFDNAVFAGNRTRDPNYALQLSGTGGDADSIDGSIYSGGDIELSGDAFVTGDLVATGLISGGSGTEGETQPIPDVETPDYAVISDYDVAALFAGATFEEADAGGSAWQLPESDPAHIFRKDPDDRGAETSGTTKDDYFLEDPYEDVNHDSDQDGSDPYLITLAGDSGDKKIFYIDGNLWLHNRSSFSFQFVNEDGSPVRVTFIVKGNIMFSDNLFYGDPELDGAAFIAIQDKDVADSGNIYFGDPAFGTLAHMDAFMYAANDFLDVNLDADGSSNVELNGIMSAGNHVAIQRDYTHSDGTVSHSQLVVNHDDRVSSGKLELSGLPKWRAGESGWVRVGWREATIDG